MSEINFNVEDLETINLSMDVGIKEIYPLLENLTVIPTKEQQVFNHENSYGYDKVTVNAISLQDKSITINENGTHSIVADNEYEGLNQVNVTVDAIEDLTEELTTYDNQLTTQETTIEDIVEAMKNKGVIPSKYAPQYITFYGYGGANLDYETENLDTSNIVDMGSMFERCSNITSLVLKNFVTSNVTDMNCMFYRLSACTLLDLSSFITKNVTNMSSIFYNCTKLKFLDIRNFTFDKVALTSSDFYGVPADCEIIVKSETEREYILTLRSDFTNIKIVAELEEV